MTKKRQKQIEDIATAILRQTGCYPASAGVLAESTGIDVKEVARCLNIELSLYDFGDDVSGVLVRDGNKTTIGYSSQTGSQRQRFTIAHELGHYVLDHQRQGVFVDTPEKYFTLFRDAKSATGEDIQEREANAFAATLLMPRELLIEAATDLYKSGRIITRNEDFDLVEPLAKRFFVSRLAMSIRLTNLDMVW
jgi:Zn-dependent peptidase ImmA (M78 family)